MPKELTLTNGNRIKVDNNDDIYVDFRDGNGYQYLCPARGTVSGGSSLQFRSFITEVMGIGGEVPGDEPKDSTYIAVIKDGGYFLGGKITTAVYGPMTTDAAIANLSEDDEDVEFHVFKRVATVGPQPKPLPLPERTVTRYE